MCWMKRLGGKTYSGEGVVRVRERLHNYVLAIAWRRGRGADSGWKKRRRSKDFKLLVHLQIFIFIFDNRGLPKIIICPP